MQKDVIIKYLPNTTTQEEMNTIRKEFNKDPVNKDVTLILIASGKGKLLDDLQSLINID